MSEGGWAAQTAGPERAELEAAFAIALRRTGALIQLMGQAAAEQVGVNLTDLNCLNILSLSGPMTAGELARATGLTTASITGVIDRLEEAGIARRERDSADRRKVVIHLVPERMAEDVARVFLPMMVNLRQLASEYSDDQLRFVVQVYERVGQLIRDNLLRLRGAD
jgi:DNA-binding MarR family transcriptional regulator